MAGALTMRVDVEGFDPIEQAIARGIVKGMVEDGLNPEKARQVGQCVAEAVAAYRRKLDEPVPSDPPWDFEARLAEFKTIAIAAMEEKGKLLDEINALAKENRRLEAELAGRR